MNELTQRNVELVGQVAILEGELKERDKRIETLKSLLRSAVKREEEKDLHIANLEAELEEVHKLLNAADNFFTRVNLLPEEEVQAFMDKLSDENIQQYIPDDFEQEIKPLPGWLEQALNDN